MTAALPEREPSRFWHRLAHWDPWVLAGSMAVLVGSQYAGPSLQIIGAGLFTACSFLMTIACHRHLFRLCPICAEKIPLDPEGEVAEHARLLRVAHLVLDHPFRGALLYVGAVSLLTLPGPFKLLAVPGLGLITTLSYADLRHRPLQPWCPRCRDWGEGGGEEKTPDLPRPLPEVRSA